MTKFIKEILPPFLYQGLKKLKPAKYGWLGNYSNWSEAVAASDGYDKENILTKVESAIEAVINGNAAFERDSVLFDEPIYNWPLIAAISQIAAKHEGNLNLIDFGGSLGSTFFQNTLFLKDLKSVSWNIVEQAHFVKIGQEKFSSEQLHFYSTIEDCLKENKVDTILLSSVLQYIEEPFALLEKIFSFGFKTIIIDRMPFNTTDQNRICVQKVPPAIYDASYPCHLLSTPGFVNFFMANKYAIVAAFDALDGKSDTYHFKGFIFER
jgi:putative methyltransferase (TIGR04325 family)